MKTTMQIAIESYKNDGVSFTDWFIDNYEMLLEKEKEQLMFFYHYGKTNGILNGKTSEEFYNQLYKQDKELPKDVKDMLNNL